MQTEELNKTIRTAKIKGEWIISMFRLGITFVFIIGFTISLFINPEIPLSAIIITYSLLVLTFTFTITLIILFKKDIYNTVIGYSNSLFDVVLITFILYLLYSHHHIIPILILITGVPWLFYIIFIILSGFRYQWRITLIVGLLSGIIYLFFYFFMLPEITVLLKNADTDTLRNAIEFLILPKGAPYMRGIIIIIIAIFAAFNSYLFKKFIDRLNRSADEKISYLNILLSGLSHDINNPLNYTIGFSDHLKNDIGQIFESSDVHIDPNLKKSILENHHYLEQGLEQIQNILNAFGHLCDKKTIATRLYNLKKQSDHTITFLSYMINQKQISISNTINKDIAIQFKWLDQVLINLLINAIEASPRGGQIKLFSNYSKDRIIISITNTSKEQLPADKQKVFLPYYTTKDKTINKGLGLTIVKSIIENINGTVSCDYIEKGKLVTFNIDIPIKFLLRKLF